MTVEGRRLTVCSPSRMRNSGVCHEFFVHIDVLLIDQFSQCSNFANLLEEVDFIFAVAVYRHTSGIISTVFQPLKSFNTCQYNTRQRDLPSRSTLIKSARDFSTR